jgi:hypothetical protein
MLQLEPGRTTMLLELELHSDAPAAEEGATLFL